jgi:dTDP-4-dehydrorhamnose reductase
MRVTLFGATGLLGKALLREWHDDEVTPLGSRDADIRNAGQVNKLVSESHPQWIVLAAAYTDVDGCETNRDLAFSVNAQGAVNVAQAAKKFGSRLVFVSTDYVFDGTKTQPYETTDRRTPKSIYGQSKAEAEVRISEILPESCIARTSWLFGNGGKCFPDTILRLAATRPELNVVNDQQGSPTYSVDLARAIIQLCHNHAAGIVHVTNRGGCTWYDLAKEVVAAAGLPTAIHPTTTDKFPRPAPRPAYSVLSPRSLDAYGITMPGWQNAVGRYLAERKLSA